MILAGYEITETISTGAATRVCRGCRVQGHTPVILKVLTSPYPTLQDVARLQHEYDIACTLDIDGIVRPYALERYGHGPALVLEDFGGISLHRFIHDDVADRGLDVARFLHVALQLVDTLARIHQHHIIHRDIKPTNILINPTTGQVKLADFGISVHMDRVNQANTDIASAEGTLAYMSPEQTGRMNRLVDYRTDFYSLGVTFYEMLTGQLPFAATNQMELIHAHLAKQPPPLSERRPDIPPVLETIVMKLLAKTAEERYQSAWGLKADLEHCLTRWQERQQIEDFVPGQHDVSDQFGIPYRLYGRQEERTRLLEAFADVGHGATVLALVSGASGTGKSMLVRDIQQPVTRTGGYFISGTCDQVQQIRPYRAVIQAFQSLVRQILTESENRIAYWKEHILTDLGQQGQVIVDVIPEVAALIGPQPPVPELPPAETSNRFHLCFKRFVQAFTRQDYPLVIFLDDVQWADTATLHLLHTLMTDTSMGYVLLIGAFNDTNRETDHVLRLRDDLQQAGVDVRHMRLEPLTLEHITSLIADAMKCSADQATPLAELLHTRTGGNPFFLSRLLHTLYQDDLLSFDYTQKRWQWDLHTIQTVRVPDDVLMFLDSKIDKLSTQSQDIIQIAACIGLQFNLKTLAVVSAQPLPEIARALRPAIQAGLLVVHSYHEGENEVYTSSWSAADAPLLVASCAFVHEHVLQTFYTMLSEQRRQEIHYRIGQWMLQNYAVEEQEEQRFATVHHLYAGRALLTSQTERNEVVALALRAGRAAREAAAYESAMRYFIMGIELLPDDRWRQMYAETLTLYNEAMEAAFLNISFGQAEHLAEMILENAHNLLDKLKVYETQIRFYCAQNQMPVGVELALDVLGMLGIALADEMPHLRYPELQTAEGVAALLDLPDMTDPYHLAALRLFTLIVPAAYQTRIDIIPRLAATMVTLCIQSGHSPLSAVPYGLYGLVLCARDEIETGYRFSRLALRLMEQRNPLALKAKRLSLFDFVRHWKEHARESLPYIQAGIQGGLDSGDIERAGYHALHYCKYLLLTGEPLERVLANQRTSLELLQQLGQQSVSLHVRAEQQMVLNLRDLPDDSGRAANWQPDRLLGESFHEQTMLPIVIQTGNSGLLFYTSSIKMYLSYLFHDAAQAVAHAHTAAQYIRAAGGMIHSALHTFYYSLALLAHAAQVDAAEQQQYREQVAANQERMHQWAASAPMNYRHKYELVEAERARLDGRLAEAMDYYDRAIDGAREQRYMQEEALANELAGRFYLELGREKIGRLYLTEAHYVYTHWGARAKAYTLEQAYPHLFGSTRLEPDQQTATALTTDRSSTGPVALDAATVIKAAQTLSSEIVLDTLLEQIIRIVIENAGAQKGFLILEREGRLLVEAEGSVEQDSFTSAPGVPVDACARLSPAIVNYVHRTHESLVLSNAAQDARFASDPYIIQHQPRALLCVPVFSRGQVTGIVYLENNLAVDAFLPDRIEITRTLIAHAAISLENARLYEDMKREIGERRRAEETLRSITEGTASVTGGDFFRSLVCYLSTVFEVRYAFVTECTDETKTRLRTLAFLCDNTFWDNFEYDMAGTPCERVVDGELLYIPENLSELYDVPEDEVSYLGAPIQNSAGEVLGHLSVIDDRPMHRMPYDMSILRIFAARAGAELERKQTEEALRYSEEELRHLNERLEDYNRNLERKVAERTLEIEQRRRVAEGLHDLLTVLNSSRSLDEILDYIVSKAIGLLGTQSGAIYRLDDEQKTFAVEAARGLPSAYVDNLRLPLHRSFLGQAVLNRQPVVVSDLGVASWREELDLDPPRRALLAEFHTLLTVPLIRQGVALEPDEIYGGVALYYPAPRQFSNEEIDLAMAFADQAALAIENARLRQRVKQAAVNEERSRLARELHDSVTQSLYSLTLLAEGWRRLAGAGRLDEMTEPLSELGGIAQQALKEMRLLVHELRPPALEKEGLLGALHERLGSVERRAGVDARLLADDVIDLPAPAEEGLYRITQEALNNALKHAEATSVTVYLKVEERVIVLEVVDNGKGFDLAHLPDHGGIGLTSMRERAEQLQGHLTIRSAPGEGTCVRIELQHCRAGGTEQHG